MAFETDETLLRRFEPVARYTKGDRFFPMDAEAYVRACSLWVWRPGEEDVCLVPHGTLTLDRLAEPPRDGFGAVHYLRFTDPQEFKDMIRQNVRRRRDARKDFRTGRGRLARVGYVSRMMDTLFSLSLLARGRVPGSTAAAGRTAYANILAENEHYRYHGRVVRQDGWIVLQYWLFYAFNDWRSGFFGANDHEADWEKVFVYLSESESGEVHPEWVAYAAHNYAGDNLRRRWDDPEVEKVGEHPVIYVGAGSHASYYAPGEYLFTRKGSGTVTFAGRLSEVRPGVVALSDKPGKAVNIQGSASIVRALQRADLIDEYHLYVHPVLLGDGKPLFAGGPRHNLELTAHKRYASGVLATTYTRTV